LIPTCPRSLRHQSSGGSASSFSSCSSTSSSVASARDSPRSPCLHASPDLSAEEVAAALGRGDSYASVGARLRVRMLLKLGHTLRDLYPCFRTQCQCTGVFFKDFFCAKSRLVAAVGVDTRGMSSPAAQDAVHSHFRAHPPSVELQFGAQRHDGCLERSLWVSPSPSSLSPSPSSSSRGASHASTTHHLPSQAAGVGCVKRGEWHLVLKPKRLPQFGQLIRCVVTASPSCLPFSPHAATTYRSSSSCSHLSSSSSSSSPDRHSVTSHAFEVRTKPSEWLCVEGLPHSWADPALVQSLLSVQAPTPCTADSERSFYAASHPGPAPLRLFVHHDGLSGCRYAFAKFTKRTQARDVMLAFMAAAARGDAHPRLGAITVSMMGSMNRQVVDDPQLEFVPAPSKCVRGQWAEQRLVSIQPQPHAARRQRSCTSSSAASSLSCQSSGPQHHTAQAHVAAASVGSLLRSRPTKRSRCDVAAPQPALQAPTSTAGAMRRNKRARITAACVLPVPLRLPRSRASVVHAPSPPPAAVLPASFSCPRSAILNPRAGSPGAVRHDSYQPADLKDTDLEDTELFSWDWLSKDAPSECGLVGRSQSASSFDVTSLFDI